MTQLLCYIIALGCFTFGASGISAPSFDPTPVDIPFQTAQPSNTPPPIITRTSFTQSGQATEPEAANQPSTGTDRWQTYRIKTGDTLSRVFARFDIAPSILHQIVRSTPVTKELTKVRPGKEIELLISEEGLLEQLRYRLNRVETLKVVRTGAGYTATKSTRAVERRTAHTTGVIRTSLSRDAKAAGLNEKLVMEMAKIFAWDIDFAIGIRKGDEFTVIYEQLFLDGQFSGVGNILAAEFINRGKTYTAVRFTDEQGVTGYYTPDGNRLRKAFLRTPVQFARISSHFNSHRRHPVLNRIRAHKGVDYAAPTGTPVHVTGEGKIVFRGRKAGYGRVVIVEHGKTYSTLYAHLSRFGKAAEGSYVGQGQTIGYVGASGLATGSHLHYEFRINGVHRNPLTVKLPNSLPIAENSRKRFRVSIAPLLSQLELYRSTLVAQADYKRAGTQ